MLRKIVSGGQTGVDRGALDAAGLLHVFIYFYTDFLRYTVLPPIYSPAEPAVLRHSLSWNYIRRV